MSEYQMNISGKIELADYSSIHDYIAIVNRNDNLTITIDDNETENFTIIKKMLEDNDFAVYQDGKCDNGRCHIKAHKK